MFSVLQGMFTLSVKLLSISPSDPADKTIQQPVGRYPIQ